MRRSANAHMSRISGSVILPGRSGGAGQVAGKKRTLRGVARLEQPPAPGFQRGADSCPSEHEELLGLGHFCLSLCLSLRVVGPKHGTANPVPSVELKSVL